MKRSTTRTFERTVPNGQKWKPKLVPYVAPKTGYCQQYGNDYENRSGSLIVLAVTGPGNNSLSSNDFTTTAVDGYPHYRVDASLEGPVQVVYNYDKDRLEITDTPLDGGTMPSLESWFAFDFDPTL